MKQRRASPSAVVTICIALGWAAGDARAQAWVAEKGSLDLQLDYNFGISNKVVADGGPDFPDAGSQSHQIVLSAEYVPVKNLAVNLALPLLFIKYTGDRMIYPHPGGGSYDDGSFHATPTDLRAGVRYQVLDEPIALAPHLGGSIPVADYETVGNAVAGRHLKMLHAGLGIGTLIGDATYAHLLYEFSLVEKYDRAPDTARHGQNRSEFALTIGHKLLDFRLDIHLDANYRMTHGGVNFSDFGSWTMDELLYHDAILRESIFLVGGGVGYQISNALVASLSARVFVLGANTQNGSVVALGIGWSPL